jgi:hypothetical protein
MIGGIASGGKHVLADIARKPHIPVNLAGSSNAMEGVLVDKSQSMVLEALTRAAREPGGLPLLGGKAGLFAANAAGKQAAQRSKSEGLVRAVRQVTKGKTTHEICVLTDKGLGLLLESELVAYLRRRHEAGSLADCPLAELYHHVRTNHPGLTIGQFHDIVRRLHESRRLYLHPWTGPLYELPEPACALLVGHEVACYASLA